MILASLVVASLAVQTSPTPQCYVYIGINSIGLTTATVTAVSDCECGIGGFSWRVLSQQGSVQPYNEGDTSEDALVRRGCIRNKVTVVAARKCGASYQTQIHWPSGLEDASNEDGTCPF